MQELRMKANEVANSQTEHESSSITVTNLAEEIRTLFLFLIYKSLLAHTWWTRI